MKAPHRLQAKLFLTSGDTVEFSRFVALFHRWIQQDELEDLLVDVHDYKHIHEGPGILLVGHEGDYSVDLARGRRGLLYRLKRGGGDDLAPALRTALRRLVKAAALVEQDSVLGRQAAFQTNEIEIQFLDRLRYPNEKEVAELLEPILSSVMRSFFGGSEADITIERIDTDTREPLAIRVLSARVPALTELTEVPEPAAVR